MIERQWARLYKATNLPQGGYFATKLDSHQAIFLELADLLAFISIDEVGVVTYNYELTEHSPGDWCSFNLFSEVGQPYQHMFETFAKQCIQLGMEEPPYYADVFTPKFNKETYYE